MLKIYCDICEEEPQDTDFSCEFTVQEVVVDLATGQQKLKKRMLQICKGCFKDNKIGEYLDKLVKKKDDNKKTK